MATKLEKQTEQAADKLARLDHAARIADRLLPDPREWTFDGEVAEDPSGQAKCSCGHPIRYIYLVRRERDGAQAPIGSTCIETTVPWLLTVGAHDLAKALEGAKARFEGLRKEADKRERETAANVEVQALRAELEGWRDGVKARLQAIADRYAGERWYPDGVYSDITELRCALRACGAALSKSASSTPGRTVATLARAMVKAWLRFDGMPAPVHPRVRAAVEKVAAEHEVDAQRYAAKGAAWWAVERVGELTRAATQIRTRMGQEVRA